MGILLSIITDYWSEIEEEEKELLSVRYVGGLSPDDEYEIGNDEFAPEMYRYQNRITLPV